MSRALWKATEQYLRDELNAPLAPLEIEILRMLCRHTDAENVADVPIDRMERYIRQPTGPRYKRSSIEAAIASLIRQRLVARVDNPPGSPRMLRKRLRILIPTETAQAAPGAA